MFLESRLRALGLCNLLGWLVLLVVVGNARAGTERSTAALRLRFLPREELTSLPVVARDVTGPPTNGNVTANATQPNVPKSSAGWSEVSQTKDRQCVSFPLHFFLFLTLDPC